MSFFKNPNIHCIEHLLTFLSKSEIVIFGETFPDLQDVVDRYWKNLRVLNFNNMTPSDIDAIMKNINLCTNLKELNYTKEHVWPKAMPRLFLRFFERISPVLEILDISGIELEGNLANILKSCDNLKSLSVKVLTDIKEFDSCGLFSDKTHLEHLSVVTRRVDGSSSNVRDELLWQLSGGELFLESIVRTVTTLKSFQFIPEYDPKSSIWKNGIIDYNEYMLSELFKKNPELEDVTLGELKTKGECLKSLPMGIKRLDMKEYSKINSDTIIRCLRSLNLESLEMNLSNVKCVNFVEDLVAAAPTLKHLALVSGYDMDLRALEGLKHLKSLRLYEFREPKDYSYERIEGVRKFSYDPFPEKNLAPLRLCNTKILYRFTSGVQKSYDPIIRVNLAPFRLCNERVYSQFTPSFVAAICKLPNDQDCGVSNKTLDSDVTSDSHYSS